MGCRALLQGIFPTLGSNPGLQHHRQILYHLSHQGRPVALILGYPELNPGSVTHEQCGLRCGYKYSCHFLPPHFHVFFEQMAEPNQNLHIADMTATSTLRGTSANLTPSYPQQHHCHIASAICRQYTAAPP